MWIEMRNISKRYHARGEMVVHEITFGMQPGETVALFGDSGSGKSTIGQMMAGILEPTEGQIFLENKALQYPFRAEARRKIQLLFQHPEVSFNPRMKLLDSLREPYRFLRRPYSLEELLKHLEDYGIYEEHLHRYPAELSGGELQRMALARIMLMNPELIVLDEPTSMLDVISQAQVIHLLEEIQREKKLCYLFISHDLELCRRFADRVLYLNEGALTERV